MPFKCNYCGGYFCSEHRLPEFHDCTGLYKQSQNNISFRFGETSASNTFNNTIRNTKTRYWFSEIELKNLAFGLLLIILIPLTWPELGLWRLIVLNPLVVLSVVCIFAIAFLLHELAHKFYAQKLGYWAEFRLNKIGLIITFLSILLPLKVVAPGAVIIGGRMYWKDYGKIAIAGPSINIAQALAYLFFYVISPNRIISYLCSIGLIINSSLALFNLIPFGVFDGAKIFKWNWRIWLLGIALAGSIYFASIIV
jgi:Zn-dependent protease